MERKDTHSKNPETLPPAVSFDDFKASLGHTAHRYSDEETERMRILFDKIADLVFDEWLAKRSAIAEAL